MQTSFISGKNARKTEGYTSVWLREVESKIFNDFLEESQIKLTICGRARTYQNVFFVECFFTQFLFEIEFPITLQQIQATFKVSHSSL